MKIGTVAQNHGDDIFGIKTDYLNFASQFGTPVAILPVKLDAFNDTYNIDALILPGGADVNPVRYGNIITYGVGNSNPYLEYFDKVILPNLIGKLPIFGICRGLQTLNVHFGGTLKNLWLHKYSQFPNDEAHKIKFPNGNKKDKIGVNSFHHQAIDKLADNFTVEALEDSLVFPVIEAISDYNNKIFAVQWHPERLGDNYSKEKFNQILQGL